ncbi:MAG: DUF5990 family protein [Acidimicrobiales bacterium]
MLVEILGTNLPGRQCAPNPLGEGHDNVHVSIGQWKEHIEPVPGDATSARWLIEVRTRTGVDGALDFGGPFVSGKRGDRFVYLNWTTVSADGVPTLFRRAKLTLNEIDVALARPAALGEGSLRVTVKLTDAKGNPTCARLRPPDIEWRLVPR